MFDHLKQSWFAPAFVLALLTVLGACSSDSVDDKGQAAADQNFNWKLVSAWPPNLPVIDAAVKKFAQDVEVMSRGQLKIQVFAGGELIPALEVFDAVADGKTVQMGHSAAYYWAGKVPAAQYMSAVPFGLGARGMVAWLHGGDGLKLWRELYAPFDLVPIPMGNTGTQMGGWFNKRVDSSADLAGLKMRIPGLGGKALASAGGNPVLLSGGEVYTALERGTIDATEWVGPLHDVRFGLDRAAKYYYYPGWQEPSAQLELIVNKTAWETLPAHLQLIVNHAAIATGVELYSGMEVGNAKAFKQLRESGHVEILEFPQDVLAVLHESAQAALSEEAAKDKNVRKVSENYEAFREMFDAWDGVTENAYRQYFNRAAK